ncbi:TetR/AcrR family transcriptional regulator [Streptococcus dentiloxodontae]
MPQDVRILKTKRDIENALIELIIEKDFPSLTVKEICQKALISRSTFYSHYLDKYDILEQLVARTIQQLNEKFAAKYQAKASSQQLKTFFDDIYDFYQDKQQLLQALLKTPFPEQASFEDEFSKHCHHYIYQTLLHKKSQHKLPDQLIAQLFTANILTLMRWTLEHGSSEELTSSIDQLHHLFFEVI